MSQHLFREPELYFQKTKRKAGNKMPNFSQNTKSNPRQSQNLCALGWDIKIFSTVNVSESSALVTTTAPSTPRSTAHTEQGIWINFPKQLYLYNESFEKLIKGHESQHWSNHCVQWVENTELFISSWKGCQHEGTGWRRSLALARTPFLRGPVWWLLARHTPTTIRAVGRQDS